MSCKRFSGFRVQYRSSNQPGYNLGRQATTGGTSDHMNVIFAAWFLLANQWRLLHFATSFVRGSGTFASSSAGAASCAAGGGGAGAAEADGATGGRAAAACPASRAGDGVLGHHPEGLHSGWLLA